MILSIEPINNTTKISACIQCKPDTHNVFEDCSIGGYWRDETPNEYCQRRRARNIRLRIRYGKLPCRVAVEDLLQHQSPLSTLCVLDTWNEKACSDYYLMQVNPAVLCQQEGLGAYTRRKHIPLGLSSSRGNHRRNYSVQATFILWTPEAILRVVVQNAHSSLPRYAHYPHKDVRLDVILWARAVL